MKRKTPTRLDWMITEADRTRQGTLQRSAGSALGLQTAVVQENFNSKTHGHTTVSWRAARCGTGALPRSLLTLKNKKAKTSK